MNLEAIVTKYPYRQNLAEEDIVKGKFHVLKENWGFLNSPVSIVPSSFNEGIIWFVVLEMLQRASYD